MNQLIKQLTPVVQERECKVCRLELAERRKERKEKQMKEFSFVSLLKINIKGLISLNHGNQLHMGAPTDLSLKISCEV